MKFLFVAESSSNITTCMDDGSLGPLDYDRSGEQKCVTQKRIICEIGYSQKLGGKNGIIAKGHWWIENCKECIFFIGIAINDKRKANNVFGFTVSNR